MVPKPFKKYYILYYNIPYLFVIGIVISDTFCGIYILFGYTFSLFSVF